MELRLAEGLELEAPYKVSLDEGALLRMDPATRMDAHNKAIGGGWLAPNEARLEENLPPVEGGDTPYLQQQNYSLAALNKRDQMEDPFGTATPAAAPAAEPMPDDSAEKALEYLALELAA